MADVHYIQWIFVGAENGGQMPYLNPGQAPAPILSWAVKNQVAVYAYCNLHGLWMTKLWCNQCKRGRFGMSLPYFDKTLCGFLLVRVLCINGMDKSRVGTLCILLNADSVQFLRGILKYETCGKRRKFDMVALQTKDN